MNTLTAAYVAGLIDGEGCLYLSPNKRKDKTRSLGFTAMLDVGMTRNAKALLNQCQKQYGGSVNRTRRATERWDEAWAWRLQGIAVGALLEDIEHHMVIKREHAQIISLALSVQRSLIPPGQQRARWTEETSEQVMGLRLRIMELNRKGPSQPLKKEPLALLVDGQFVTPQRDLFGSLSSEPFTGPWPPAGMMSHGVVWTVSSSVWPKDAAVCSLSAILEENVHPKYSLSPKACRGILRRAARRGRELPRALYHALSAASGAETTPEQTRERPS